MTELDRLITELCPNGVEFVKLEEVAHIGTGSSNTVDGLSEGLYPFFVRSQEVRYKNSYEFDEIAIITSGDGVGVGKIFHYVEGKYALHQRAYRISIKDNRLDSRFYYYMLATFYDYISSNAYHASVTSIRRPMLNNYPVPLPPLEVQCKIVQILDNFTELTAELTARKKQYNYYRDELLTFGDNVPMVALADIATEMYRGSGIKRDEVTETGTPCVRYGEIYTTYNIWFDTCVSRTQTGSKTFEHGDILFAITGESVEEIAKSCVYMGHEKCFAGGDIVVMKHSQNPKYISYALSTTNAHMQKSKGKVKSKVVHSSIPALREIAIPLPSLAEQERIVSILDRFDTLTTDISSGLPAEIVARQTQYEYYRDKLLTF